MEEQKNTSITAESITLARITLTRITLTPYGCGMILEALRVLAENDESLRADATSLKVCFQDRIEAALREERSG